MDLVRVEMYLVLLQRWLPRIQKQAAQNLMMLVYIGISSVTDGGKGARRPPGKLNVKTGPL